MVASRLATDAEVTTWQEEGWILIEGLVGAEEIDAVAEDLREIFPSADELHADPEGVTERWKGHPVEPKEVFVWPDEGPGFRPEQQRWSATFPFPGMTLNRLCVHPSIVDFAERALGAPTSVCTRRAPSAKYAGVTNYEQPMHIDRNHSWLPPGSESPWWNLEGFLYLSDISDADNPTRLVSMRDSDHIESPYGVVMPNMEPGVYAAERPAPGIRGSYLAYRSDCWHRGAPFGSATGSPVRGLYRLQERGRRVDRVQHPAVRVDEHRVDCLRGGLDAPGAGALRLAAAGTPGLERAADRTDTAAVSRA